MKNILNRALTLCGIAGFAMAITAGAQTAAPASPNISTTYQPIAHYYNYNVANNYPTGNDCSGTPSTFNSLPVLYVSANTGSDSSSTGNYAHSYKTLTHAASVVVSGQLVCAVNGTYQPFTIAKSGANYNNIIRFEVVPGNTATVDLTLQAGSPATYQWAGINIENGSYNSQTGLYTTSPIHYVLVSGFYVHGPDDAINASPNGLATAMSSSNEGTAYYSSSCIQVAGNQTGSSTFVANSEADHIYIIGNNIEGCPGEGIGTGFADYVTIGDNTVSNCSWYSIYGQSGISMFADYDTNPADKSSPYVYKNYIINNTVFNNYEYVPWAYAYGGPAITDGEGIIIDTNLNTDAYGTYYGSGSNLQYVVRYSGFTLVENNVVYANGSAGIETVASQNVDIMYNTLFNDDLNYRVCPSPPNGCFQGEQGKGEIFLYDSININIGDNILYSSIYDTGVAQVLSSNWGNYTPSSYYVTTALLTPNFFQNFGYNPWGLGNAWIPAYTPGGPSSFGNNGGNPGFTSGNAWANGTSGNMAAGEQATAYTSVNLTIPTTTSSNIQNGWAYLMLTTDRNGTARVQTSSGSQTYSVGAYFIPY